MSDIRFNQWLHQSGTGGVTQLSSGHVGIGTTSPLIPVHSGNNAVLNVGVVTANNIYAGTLNGTLALSDISGITGSFTSDVSINGNLDIADKIRHIGDTNTSLRFPAFDTITAETNNVERVRIESNGRIAIGNHTGASHDIHIKHATSPGIRLEDTTNNVKLTMFAQDANSGIANFSNHDLLFYTNSLERLRIGTSGQLGIAGANYGSSGQVLTSQGSGSAPTWASVSAPSGFKNLIINGDMRVAQRGAGPVAVSNNNNEGYQTIDRMRLGFGNNAVGACNISQSTDAPTTLGFTKSHKTDVTTVNTTASGQEIIQMFYRIEGQTLRNSGWNHLSSSSFLTLSFYFKTTKTGTSKLPIMFRTRHGTNYYYVQNVTVTDPTNWNRYTVTIPGNSNIQIDDANTVGMDINFTYYSGPDKDTSSEGSWGSTNAYSTSDSTNYFDSTSNDMFLTGIQLEVGDTATSFQHRSFTDEELLCQRYFWKFIGSIYGGAYGGIGFCNYSLPTRMRIKGALSYTGLRTSSSFYDYSTAQILQIQMGATNPYISNPQLDSEL